VPRRSLELFAVGLDRFEKAIDEELDAVAAGGGRLKAVRGEYGCGKTFFAHWLMNRARARGFATTLVQISETETPLYRLEKVYRRAVEGLHTKEWSDGTFRSLVERWFFDLEEEVLEDGSIDAADTEAFSRAVGELLEKRLVAVGATEPQFAAALRRYHAARVGGQHAIAEGLIAWLMGQPNVGASIKREANLKGDLDNDGAAGFLRGLLEVLRQTGRPGMVLVLDELETIQRVRADSREKSLNGLRQLVDDLHKGRYPGLYVLITGTPLFFDGQQGVRRSTPLADRLHTPFGKDPKFDNARAPQLRLQPFDLDRMREVGQRVLSLYPSEAPERIASTVDDAFLESLARGVAGKLGALSVAPRIYLKRLVDVLDRIEEHPDFDPRKHYDIAVDASELTDEERASAGVVRSVDEIVLDVKDSRESTSERKSDGESDS
jgi:hypothetical protein